MEEKKELIESEEQQMKIEILDDKNSETEIQGLDNIPIVLSESIILENKQIATTPTQTINNIELDSIIGKLVENKVFAIQDNIKINDNYENIFAVSPSKNHKTLKRSSEVLSELKDDNTLMRKSIFTTNEEYLKPEEHKLDIMSIEKSVKEIEIKYNLDKRADLYKLYDTIKNCKLSTSSNLGYNNTNIGPVSTLEYMVESTFGFDRNLKQNIIEHIISLEKYIFRWRSILGDGNCYFRAVIFAYLENLIFEKNVTMIKNIMIEVNAKFSETYSNTRILPHNIKTELTSMNTMLIIKILYLICEVLDNNESDSVMKAYEILLKCFNYCAIFDLGMITYFRYMMYEYIKKNGYMLYSKDFSVKIGNLLPSEYETEEGGNLQ
jgi:hypothetical protein